MNAPKCRICGMREHNHRCQGGTPAMRVEERARVRAHAREADAHLGCPAWPNCADDPARCLLRGAVDMDDIPGHRDGTPAEAVHKSTRARWHDDSDAAGEPVEVRTYDRKPARFYAPPGECAYCDRRREAARRSMAAVRERGTDA